MSFISNLSKHDKSPGSFWGSSSSAPDDTPSPDRSEYNPENDDVCLISTRSTKRAQPTRSCVKTTTERNAAKKKCIEIEDDPKHVPCSSSTDKSPEHYVKGNDFIIPKLKSKTCEATTLESAKEMSSEKPRNSKDFDDECSKDNIFCPSCSGAMTNSGCVKCTKQNTNKLPSVSVDSFYHSKSGICKRRYGLTYSSAKRVPATPFRRKRILSRSPEMKNQKSTLLISSDEDNSNEQTKKLNETETRIKEVTDRLQNPNNENELESYQRDSVETLLHAQDIYVGRLRGNAIDPVKVTAEKIEISIVNGNTEYNFVMRGRDVTSFMINNKLKPFVVVIEPTQRWAQEINKKYQELDIFVNPGSSICEKERQIVLLLNEKLEKESLSDLMELVKERLCENSVWKIMTPESAKTIFQRLPPRSNFKDPPSSVGYSTLSSFSSSSSVLTKRKSYNTRSKDLTIVEPKRSPEKVLVYPPHCKYGAITITTDDVQCLDHGTYLNDVIIDFFIKYLFEEVLTPTDKERTYIFSSFFYKRLTQKSSNSDQESRLAENMYKKVKTWTKNVDIFDKDFLILPINESSHWYLTVICHHGLVAERDSNQENSTDSSDAVTRSPCILIFDSLGCHYRSTVLINLRNYLSCEWKERKENDNPLIFNKLNLKGCYPKVPGQQNSSDCGVYVLQYVESFFENPITDYQAPITIPEWFPRDTVDKKREFVKNLIVKLKDRVVIEDS